MILVYIYIYIYTYVYMYVSINICLRVYIYMYTCMYLSINEYICFCMSMWIYKHVYILIHEYIHIYIIYVFVYIYIYVCVCWLLSQLGFDSSYGKILSSHTDEFWLNETDLSVDDYRDIYTPLPPWGWVLWRRSNRVAISVYYKPLRRWIEVSATIERMYVNNSNCDL